ncbi:MAG: hypothetical protein IJ251_07625 [Oscillospiraceae bacterium]|nr:hypothetical protein [Oscillospiraceae bacterium]
MNVYKCPSCGASFDPLKVTFLSTVNCEFCGQTVSVYGEQYQQRIITKIKQIKLALQDKDCEKAQKLCKSALNIDVENAEIYYLKLLSDWWLYDEDRIQNATHTKLLADGEHSYGFKDDPDFQKAYRFGNVDFKKYLERFDANVVYNTGVEKQQYGQYKDAIQAFEQIENIGYKDTKQRLAECRSLLKRERVNSVSQNYNSEKNRNSDAKNGNKDIKQSIKSFRKWLIFIAACCLFIIVFSRPLGSSKPDKPDKEDQQTQTILPDDIVDRYNADHSVKLVSKGTFTPSDRDSGHYRTEFRLPAFRDAIGKTYDMDGKTVDIIVYQSIYEYNIRIYADGLSFSQCKDLIEGFSPLLDESLTTSDLNETISYLEERKEANGYYYGDLGLVVLGNSAKGYHLMIKKE